MEFNKDEFTKKAVDFLKDYLNKCGKNKFVIGLSGGVDSAVALALGVKAIGKENIIAISLPNGDAGENATDYAKMVADKFDVKLQTINIKPITSELSSLLNEKNNVRLGNFAARTRMIVLYNEAAENNALVLGTENKTEHYLGYFTKAGDEVSDIETIRDLYKTQVFELARYLGVPEEIIKKAPTADLWDGQTDEEELGITYREADLALLNTIDGKDVEYNKEAKKIVNKRMAKIGYKLSDTPFPLLK